MLLIYLVLYIDRQNTFIIQSLTHLALFLEFAEKLKDAAVNKIFSQGKYFCSYIKGKRQLTP